jgi:hypothetical protein
VPDIACQCSGYKFIAGVIMDHNHATSVREGKAETRQYHAKHNLPLMVSMFSASLHAINTMNNTMLRICRQTQLIS